MDQVNEGGRVSPTPRDHDRTPDLPEELFSLWNDGGDPPRDISQRSQSRPVFPFRIDDGSVRSFLDQIGGILLLTAEDERRLGEKKKKIEESILAAIRSSTIPTISFRTLAWKILVHEEIGSFYRKHSRLPRRETLLRRIHDVPEADRYRLAKELLHERRSGTKVMEYWVVYLIEEYDVVVKDLSSFLANASFLVFEHPSEEVRLRWRRYVKREFGIEPSRRLRGIPKASIQRAISHLESLRDTLRDIHHRFVERTMRLVVSIAKRYASHMFPLLDAINEGTFGLMIAAARFDHERGVKFSTYATPWIWQAIERARAEQARIVGIPVERFMRTRRLYRVAGTFFSEFGRNPTVDELAQRIQWSVPEIKSYLKYLDPEFSLDEIPIVKDTNVLYPIDLLYERDRIVHIWKILEELDVIERDVLKKHFLDDRTLEDIGRDYGVTPERIRQIKARALKRLRHPLRASRLREFIE